MSSRFGTYSFPFVHLSAAMGSAVSATINVTHEGRDVLFDGIHVTAIDTATGRDALHNVHVGKLTVGTDDMLDKGGAPGLLFRDRLRLPEGAKRLALTTGLEITITFVRYSYAEITLCAATLFTRPKPLSRRELRALYAERAAARAAAGDDESLFSFLEDAEGDAQTRAICARIDAEHATYCKGPPCAYCDNAAKSRAVGGP